MPTELAKIPDGYKEHPHPLMTSLDGSIDRDVQLLLREGDLFAGYPGWEFYAKCWYGEGEWHAEVWSWGLHRETVSADTPDEIMRDLTVRYERRER